MKLERLLEEWRNEWYRLTGAIFGPPGTGKTTFMKLLQRRSLGDVAVYVALKDCREGYIEVDKKVVASKIGSILHFMAESPIKPSIDRLSIMLKNHDYELEDVAKVLATFDIKVREWLEPKIRALLEYVQNGSVRIPVCLKDEDEVSRRLVLGMLYAARPYIPRLILLDDLLGFVVVERLEEAFVAMMRPIILAVNHYPDTREMMMFNPVVLTPGGYPSRVARPDKYVVIWDGRRYEIKRSEVERL